MKQILVASLLICCTAVTNLSRTNAASLQQDEANVVFTWGFGAIVGPPEDRRFVPVTRDTIMMTGDSLKMLLALKKECFVYVIHQSPTGEVQLLFPYDLKQFTSDYAVGKNYYIPKGRAWYWLDKNVGRESFYLLASKQRLTKLESLVADYMVAKGTKKMDMAKDVVAEIRSEKKRHKSFATLAERPINIGGNVRGTLGERGGQLPDVADISSEISAQNFYSKTVTIEHQ